jgi:hypothetical protein
LLYSVGFWLQDTTPDHGWVYNVFSSIYLCADCPTRKSVSGQLVRELACRKSVILAPPQQNEPHRSATTQAYSIGLTIHHPRDKRVFITNVKGTFLGMSESEEASKRR